MEEMKCKVFVFDSDLSLNRIEKKLKQLIKMYNKLFGLKKEYKKILLHMEEVNETNSDDLFKCIKNSGDNIPIENLYGKKTIYLLNMRYTPTCLFDIICELFNAKCYDF
jgi:argonaute-like protein implicated in RNA metabolism and viral defense